MKNDETIGGLFIPPSVWGREELTMMDKCLYGRILSLSNKQGYCWASNKWLAEDFGCSPRTVKKHLHTLAAQGAIRRKVIRDDETNKVIERRLYPLLNAEDAAERGESPHDDGGSGENFSPRVGRKSSCSRARHTNFECSRERTRARPREEHLNSVKPSLETSRSVDDPLAYMRHRDNLEIIAKHYEAVWEQKAAMAPSTANRLASLLDDYGTDDVLTVIKNAKALADAGDEWWQRKHSLKHILAQFQDLLTADLSAQGGTADHPYAEQERREREMMEKARKEGKSSGRL